MKILLWSLVAFHIFMILLNVAAFFILPFYAPWYVAAPLITYLSALFFTPVPCPLTKLEDRIRIKMGKSPIKHFIGHYFVWPLKKALRSRNERSE